LWPSPLPLSEAAEEHGGSATDPDLEHWQAIWWSNYLKEKETWRRFKLASVVLWVCLWVCYGIYLLYDGTQLADYCAAHFFRFGYFYPSFYIGIFVSPICVWFFDDLGYAMVMVWVVLLDVGVRTYYRLDVDIDIDRYLDDELCIWITRLRAFVFS
jgi:hypothetical protein